MYDLVSVADPGSGALLTRGSGRGKKLDPDPGSGINTPVHFSESLETVFWVKNTYMEKFKSGIRDKLPDPQNWMLFVVLYVTNDKFF